MQFRYDIQGMRAIAVLAVMVFHANANWLPAGFLGVDIFFVISGFIITTQILSKENDFSWKQFYLNRIKRIVPAYLFLLLVVTLIASILLLSIDFSYYAKSLKSALYFYSNSYFSNFGDYFAPSVTELPLLHTWSLALEMQFYFILPLLLFIVPKRLQLSLFLILSILLLSWAEYRISYRNTSVYFSLLARIPEFLAGVILALYINNRPPLPAHISNYVGILGLTIVFISFFIISETHYPGYLSLLPTLGAVLLISAQTSIINNFLGNKLLVWIGAISYSLYLWHWPILAFIRYYTENYELSIHLLILYWLASFILAWLSYQYIEQKFKKIKSSYAVFIIAISTVVLWGLIPIATKANQYLSPNVPGKYVKYGGVNNICHGKLLESCIRGAKKDTIDALVIGDSHAAQLNQFFDEVGHSNNLTFEVITASSCVPINGFDVERISNWAHEACRSQIEAVKERLFNQKVLVIAGMWSYQLASSKFETAFYNFLQDASSGYNKVIIISQLPKFSGNVLRQYRFNSLGLPKQTQMLDDWLNANKKLQEISQSFPNVTVFDVSGNKIFKSGPFYNNQLFYADDHHINDLGIELYQQEAEKDFIELFDRN